MMSGAGAQRSADAAVPGRAEDAVLGPDPARLDPAQIHRRYWLGLVRMAALLTGDRAAAEDIVQDAFVSMGSRWQRWDDTAPAVRYLRACVLNGARSLGRRRGLAGRLPVDRVQDQPAAEDEALDRLRSERIAAVVRELPERQREIVVLRYFGELTITETAAQLGISESAVKSSAHRALQTLAARWKAVDW